MESVIKKTACILSEHFIFLLFCHEKLRKSFFQIFHRLKGILWGYFAGEIMSYGKKFYHGHKKNNCDYKFTR